MWEDGNFIDIDPGRYCGQNREEGERRNEQIRESEKRERERQRNEDEKKRREDSERSYRNAQYAEERRRKTYSNPAYDGYEHYTMTIPAPPFSIGRLIAKIIGAVVCGGVVGYFFGLFGLIGGALFGWILGGLIGIKFMIILVILGVLGCGLYYGKSHIAPLFSFVTDKVTDKALPLSEGTATITDDVNFRIEPSTDSAVIKTLKQGETVTSTGKVSGGWTQVSHNGDTGWVSSEYLKK
jgi:uncharacterized protein YgiM (DUF1202 family)